MASQLNIPLKGVEGPVELQVKRTWECEAALIRADGYVNAPTKIGPFYSISIPRSVASWIGRLMLSFRFQMIVFERKTRMKCKEAP